MKTFCACENCKVRLLGYNPPKYCQECISKAKDLNYELK